MSKLDAVNKALPQYTTTASSETTSATESSTTGSSTTSLQIPTVTPPSPEGNPNIWTHDHRANGTVFIAVGAVVGAIFVAMLLWTVISSHLSRRIAKKTLTEDNYVGQRRAGTGDYDDGDDKMFLAALRGSDEEKMDEKSSKNRLSLFMGGSNLKGSTSWDSLPEYVPELNYAPQERLNPIQDYPRYNRNSLFISPTLEVAQQQQGRSRIEKPYHQSSLSTSSLVSSDKSTPLLINDLHRPERAASPERKEKKTPGGYHKRNNSSLAVSTVESNSSDRGSSERKPRGGHKKKTPSMYLDDMLKGGEDSI